jgi:hypothetical protein
VPPCGTYLTDGRSLFRVAHLLPEMPTGERFLELEDCCTLEAVLCTARSLLASPIRMVTPVADRTDHPPFAAAGDGARG